MAFFTKCRICICTLKEPNGKYDMKKIPLLAQKFSTCTDLAIPTEEHLPTELCRPCHDKLEHFYLFRSQCIASDTKWRMEMLANKQITTVETQRSTAFIEETNAIVEITESVEANEGNTSTVNPETCLFKCDLCSARFLVEHRLVAHKRQHDGLMPYPCTEDGCDRAFNRLHCLSEHLKQHVGDTSLFNCEQAGCNKSYRHKPTLVMHMRRCHNLGPELRSHVCEFCGKIFNSSAVLNDHRYTHRDKSQLPHACSESNCNQRFSTKEKLKVHMLRHAGIKNFSCPYCGLRKTTRNELKIHINYHTLERTYCCRFCSKVCHSSGNLKLHVRTVHERAKDYACSHCDRRFAKPDTRKYHEMTHTGEKPNSCVDCGKRFTQPAALRTHRKIHERLRQKTLATTTVYTLALSAPTE
ncbi:zinc finger protein 782-like [Drosophila busckii]|uniref:zinc finger protein 782-like n=1 Tax=Drosophila busckii TaxID=30019 RepID=UPI00083F0722|nr:zinc finger protein 782-like [Drosophila busckii]